jgi:hypothetical protein
MVPFVVGPKAVPVVDDVEAARRDPELVVLSAMAHGKAEVGLRIATAALEACRDLDEERGVLYLDLIELSLSDIARTAFEDLMASGNYEFQTEFAKKHRAAGRALGEATAVVTFLRTRGVAVSGEQEKRILACVDLDVLDRWIRKAVTVASADELFTDRGSPPVTATAASAARVRGEEPCRRSRASRLGGPGCRSGPPSSARP